MAYNVGWGGVLSVLELLPENELSFLADSNMTTIHQLDSFGSNFERRNTFSVSEFLLPSLIGK